MTVYYTKDSWCFGKLQAVDRQFKIAVCKYLIADGRLRLIDCRPQTAEAKYRAKAECEATNQQFEANTILRREIVTWINYIKMQGL